MPVTLINGNTIATTTIITKVIILLPLGSAHCMMVRIVKNRIAESS